MRSKRRRKVENILISLSQEYHIRPSDKHSASVAKVIDELIGVDEFVGLVNEPDNPSENITNIGFRVGGVIYDGSRISYETNTEYIKSNVPNYKLDKDNPMNYFWCGRKLPDVPKRDISEIRSIVLSNTKRKLD